MPNLPLADTSRRFPALNQSTQEYIRFFRSGHFTHTEVDLKINHHDLGLLNEHEVSELTGFNLATLTRLRACGLGIPYYMVGSTVWYFKEDVINYIKARIKSTSDQYPDGRDHFSVHADEELERVLYEE